MYIFFFSFPYLVLQRSGITVALKIYTSTHVFFLSTFRNQQGNFNNPPALDQDKDQDQDNEDKVKNK